MRQGLLHARVRDAEVEHEPEPIGPDGKAPHALLASAVATSGAEGTSTITMLVSGRDTVLPWACRPSATVAARRWSSASRLHVMVERI